MNYKNLVLSTLATLALMSFSPNCANAQITSWPITKIYVGVSPGEACGITMQISYCWKNTGQEKSVRTRTWAMLPGQTSFDPLNLGMEPNGEFSPDDPQPIKAITIDGVTIDENNPCGCFSHNGCCYEICIDHGAITITYYDCSDGSWPPCGSVHSY